jgi:hydroxyacylglutathione hydrolase
LLVAAGEAALVDGPEAGPVLEYCAAHQLRLTTILTTHTHHDHIGVNLDLQRRGLLGGMRVVGARKTAAAIPGISEQVDEGDEIEFAGARGLVMLTEGHLQGHLSYLFEDVLFCGDTLFAGGCGYLCEDMPALMFASLRRLAALPGETRICCAHEYTQDNLRFAWSIDAGNEALARRIREVWALRAAGECAVPSTIAEERATNPFLRSEIPALSERVAAAMGQTLTDPAAVFAATRALKNRKDYRGLSDADLPL